jgi:hypothetical protein
MNTTTTKNTKRNQWLATATRFPNNHEGMLLSRCERLWHTRGLAFVGAGQIRIRDRYYKGRFSSRLFRAAVEILTRRESRIHSLVEDAAGLPNQVLLHCGHCIAANDGWAPIDSPFLPDYDPEDGPDAELTGCCMGCWARVELYRDARSLAWRATIHRPHQDSYLR